MKPIFLYLKTADIGEGTLDALREHGYLPVGVDSIDDVRIMQPVSPEEQGFAAAEALRIVTTDFSVQRPFARAVAARVLGKIESQDQ